MQIQVSDIEIETPDGRMPAVSCIAEGGGRNPAVLLLMEAFGVTPHIRDVAERIAREGYVVVVPDLYYRERADHTFGYDEVQQAMEAMYRLDFGKPMEADLGAALAYLKTQPEVDPHGIGVMGFCLGGGLTFLTACRFSSEIAAAAPFYGMVLDEWIDAVADITVPVYQFFGGLGPYIPPVRVRQIEARFRELDKDYRMRVYPEADHGFFCNERSSYNRTAAEDAWQELLRFFAEHLKGRAPEGAG